MSINSVTFFSITVGLGAFIYHERYVNKPHTLDDGFSDSGGCSTSVDDSIGRVSHIDCSGLDITTVSSFSSALFFSLRIAYSLQGLPPIQWGQRRFLDLHCYMCYLYRGKQWLWLLARAEICQKFGWLFGRFEDTKISF
jgi:hypothetical protein